MLRRRVDYSAKKRERSHRLQRSLSAAELYRVGQGGAHPGLTAAGARQMQPGGGPLLWHSGSSSALPPARGLARNAVHASAHPSALGHGHGPGSAHSLLLDSRYGTLPVTHTWTLSAGRDRRLDPHINGFAHVWMMPRMGQSQMRKAPNLLMRLPSIAPDGRAKFSAVLPASQPGYRVDPRGGWAEPGGGFGEAEELSRAKGDKHRAAARMTAPAHFG